MTITTIMVQVFTKRDWLLRIAACLSARDFTRNSNFLVVRGSDVRGEYAMGRRRPRREFRRIGVVLLDIASSSWEQLDLVSL